MRGPDFGIQRVPKLATVQGARLQIWWPPLCIATPMHLMGTYLAGVFLIGVHLIGVSYSLHCRHLVQPLGNDP